RQPGRQPPYMPLLTPSSQTSLPATMPSPQTGAHWLTVCVKPLSVRVYVEPQVWRSAWNRSIEYMPPLTRPREAAIAGVSVMLPLAGGCRPPRSTASLPLMKHHTSSSPVKLNVGEEAEEYVNG